MITTNEAWPYPSHPAMHPKEENKVIVATSSKLMNIQNGWLGSRLLVSGKLWTLYVRRQKMWKAELALSRENHRCSRRRSLRLLFVKEAEKENARKVAIRVIISVTPLACARRGPRAPAQHQTQSVTWRYHKRGQRSPEQTVVLHRGGGKQAYYGSGRGFVGGTVVPSLLRKRSC